MTFLGFALVLTAAFCHATWNYFVKRINAGPELVWLFSIISAVVYFPAALYFGAGVPSFTAMQWLFLAGTVALHMAYFLLLQFAYTKGDLSLIYPTARATGPLLSSCIAVFLLGEDMTIQTATGGLIIIFGVLNLTGGLRRGRGNASVSMGFGLAIGTLIGSYTVWDAYAVSTLLIPPLIHDYASSIGRSVLLSPVAWRRRALVRQIWAQHRTGVIIIALFNPLAYILVLVALTFTPVIFVAPIRELSVLLTVLMGSILLSEGHLRHRLIWAAVILAGVIILATSG